MYKVIIVDDERLIRESLKLTIDWESMGACIVGEAKDGYEALDVIQREKPDIMITDIRMPRLNGLELIEILRQREIVCKVIIISGYEDFSYAQQAVKLGAIGYILKPLENPEIMKAVTKAIKIVENEAYRDAKIIRLETLVLESMPVIREKILVDLVNGILQENDEIQRQLEFVKISFHAGYKAIMIVEINNFIQIFQEKSEMHTQGVRLYIEDLIRKQLEPEGEIVFRNKTNQFAVISSTKESVSSKGMSDYLQKLAHNIRRIIQKELDLSVSFGISRMKKEPKDLHIAYNEAIIAVSDKFYNSKNSLIFIDDVEQIKDFQLSSLVNIEKELLSYIEIGDRDKVEEKLKSYFDMLKKDTKGNIMMSRAFAYILIVRLHQFIQESLDSEILLGNLKELYTYVERCESFEDIKEKTENLTSNILRFLDQKWNNRYGLIIEKAKGFIGANYTRDLSLSEVAEYTGISACYFSQLFKQHSGTNFSQYLNQLRIDKSKELLRNRDLTVSKISSKVGYRDVKYFNKIFKKFEVITPSEYRKDI